MSEYSAAQRKAPSDRMKAPLDRMKAPLDRMKAACVHQFGGVEAIRYEEAARPVPGEGQVLVRIKAAGVGPWDAWVRSGRSALRQPLPLILGSDLAGVIEEVGPGVDGFDCGEDVFGVTNPRFTDAYAEYAAADAAMIARKPTGLSFIEAASVPVVSVTAWQMVFDYGRLDDTKRILVHGAAGNVGSFVVQLAKAAGAEVIATAFTRDVDYVRALNADQVIDVQAIRFEEAAQDVDVVCDLVGGDTLERSFEILKPGGVLVSAVARPDPEKAARHGIRAEYFIVAVTTECLTRIAERFRSGQLITHVGEVLPLAQARLAHEMLAGKPHKPGRIVLTMETETA